MEQSLTLLSAQVHLLDTELALIHIPLRLYNAFLQPILHLLIPANASDFGPDGVSSGAYDHAFLNVSITPFECSVACSRELATRLFAPARENLDMALRKEVVISKDDYIVMQVDGEGLDAGQRVVELTAPLAMNGISLFFISTYFSDYILVPLRSRSTVVEALEARGFAFESQTDAFVNIASPFLSHNTNAFSPRPTSGTMTSSTGSLDGPFDRAFSAPISTSQRPPQTPPPSSLTELQSRTFATLKRRNITPHADPTIRCIQCAERKPASRGSGNEARVIRANTAMRMQVALVKCLVTAPRPRFFSLTLTEAEAASLLLERRLLPNFEDMEVPALGAPGSLLLGDADEVLVPIVLDLRELPMESTGIVCGVAGRLVAGGPAQRDQDDEDEDDASPLAGPGGGVLEMSYLSTARAGTVIVSEAALERAMSVLGLEVG